MTGREEVELAPATPADATLLANLLELYLHDLSETFPIELDAFGRFNYPKLDLYWSEPDRRFPFLIRCGPRIAGFALVTRGSPASDDPEVLDIAEFFIARRHRRTGIGRQAAILLWNRLPGRWIVRVSEGNRRALPFWTAVVDEYTHGTFNEEKRLGSPSDWRVFSFERS